LLDRVRWHLRVKHYNGRDQALSYALNAPVMADATGRF